MSFEGKVAFITGAAGSIGRATALAFARQGAKLALADFASCEETADLVRREGAEVVTIKCDVADPASCKNAVAATVKAFGALDHAFNNAGVAGSYQNHWDEDGIRNTININLLGVIWCAKYEIEFMGEHGGGTIVNTASIAGLSGLLGGGGWDYIASKHGVVGFTKSVALKYGPNIRVNAVCPGFIETDMTAPLHGRNDDFLRRVSPITGKFGEPDDIAQAVLWLSSPASKFVFGVALPVDGGFMI
jgi:NAD(P)-dependent dehydrogenase (short-subunit alcohol dehydrogenase family)